jgi:acetyl-CoA carboxylase beta subunit
LQEVVKCPVCNKRIFDIEWRDDTTVCMKCPHCHNVVTIKKTKPAKIK